MLSKLLPDKTCSAVSHLLLENPNSSLFLYSYVFAEPFIGLIEGKSIFPIRISWSYICCCLALSCSSYGRICHLQPPQIPKWQHVASCLISLFFLRLAMRASQYLCFFLVICKSTTSPGTA